MGILSLVLFTGEANKADHGAYPTSLDALQNANLISTKDTLDAWGNAIKLAGGGDTQPVITSAGKDGAFGKEDDLPKQEASE